RARRPRGGPSGVASRRQHGGWRAAAAVAPPRRRRGAGADRRATPRALRRARNRGGVALRARARSGQLPVADGARARGTGGGRPPRDRPPVRAVRRAGRRAGPGSARGVRAARGNGGTHPAPLGRRDGGRVAGVPVMKARFFYPATLILATLAAGCGPLDVGSDLYWTARFETGDFSEWTSQPGGQAEMFPA